MRVLTGETGNVYDVPAASPFHHRQHVVTGVENAEKIGLERLPEFVPAHLLDGLAHNADAGIVYKNVDAAEPALTFFKEHADLILTADVTDLAVRRPVLREGFDGAFKLAFVASADEHP
jgi:hypothetical protein